MEVDAPWSEWISSSAQPSWSASNSLRMVWKLRVSPRAPVASPARSVVDQLESDESSTGVASIRGDSGFDDTVFNDGGCEESTFDDSSLNASSLNQAVIRNTDELTSFHRARTKRRGSVSGVRRKARMS